MTLVAANDKVQQIHESPFKCIVNYSRWLALTILLFGGSPFIFVNGFVLPSGGTHRRPQPCRDRNRNLYLSKSNVPTDLIEQVRTVAERLWSVDKNFNLNDVLPKRDTCAHTVSGTPETEREPQTQHALVLCGEASFRDSTKKVKYHERAAYFEAQSYKGDARAQHSFGLLLWSGFGVTRDEFASAKWHAAAAAQNHLDSMAVLGGCLRTGTGVQRDMELGLRLIEHCAEQGNPTGINKKAAGMEANSDHSGAFQLYQDCFSNSHRGDTTTNALLLFNLGWCLVNGEGTNQNKLEGEALWHQATEMAPDEGSEEAAWFLYRQYTDTDSKEKEARQYLQLARDLGHEDALEIQ